MTVKEILDWAWTVFSHEISLPIADGVRAAFEGRFHHGTQRLVSHPRVWQRERGEIERVLRMMGAATQVAASVSKGFVDPELSITTIDALATASGTPFCPPAD